MCSHLLPNSDNCDSEFHTLASSVKDVNRFEGSTDDRLHFDIEYVNSNSSVNRNIVLMNRCI